MPKVIDLKQILTGIYKITQYLNLIFYITRTSKLTIPLKFKNFKYEYLFKTISVIFELKKLG